MAYVDFMANQTDTRVPRFGLSSDSIGSPFLLPSFSGIFQSFPTTTAAAVSSGSPNTVCPNCYQQYDDSPSFLPYGGESTAVCPNCRHTHGRHGIVPTTSSSSSNGIGEDSIAASLMMGDRDFLDSFNMLNVVDDVLREDNKLETQPQQPSSALPPAPAPAAPPPPHAQCSFCSQCGARMQLSSQFVFTHSGGLAAVEMGPQETICPSCYSSNNYSMDYDHLHNSTESQLNPAAVVVSLPPLRPAHSTQSPTSCFSEEEETDEDTASNFAKYCDVHENEQIRYFCQPCAALLCYRCIANGHQHHPHTTIREAYERITPSVDNILTSVSQKMKHLGVSIDSVSGMKDKIQRKKEEAIEKVQRMFQSYREALIKHEKDILAQISVLTDLRLKSLAKEKEVNEKMMMSLRGLQKNVPEAKDPKKKASTLLLYHTIAKQLDSCPDGKFSNFPLEDDSFVVKADHSCISESLKSLCVLTTAPYPPLCFAMGEGLFHPRVNRLTTVLVTTKDRMGEPCTEGGQQLLVTLKSINGSLLKVEVRDNQDGSYSLSFRPKVKGEHQLSITMRGHHIKGSPFKLDVDGGREYSHFGVVTNIFGSEGNKPGQFCRPWGITSDQKGHIIVGDRSNHRIQVFDSNGALKTMFGSEGNGQGQFNRPAGVATTREGHVVVADKDNHRIQVLKLDGTFLFKFGSKGGNDGQMIYPYDVAVNQVDGRIAVTDTGNHRLLIFSCDGILLGKFGYKGYLCGHFDSPRGIAFNDEGHIIVSDFNVHHILVIHPDGTTARILGSQGVGNGQFMRPQGIAVDHMGNFVIADTRNSRIVIMHPSGHFIAKFGSPGSGQGQLDRPTSVCVLPDGRVAVVDFGNSRVQIF